LRHVVGDGGLATDVCIDGIRRNITLLFGEDGLLL
jgi:hypothetical protein